MFSRGATDEQFSALRDVVAAQSAVIEAQGQKLEIVAGMASQASTEAHYMKGLLGAVFAELAARSDDPYKELTQILRRARFVGSEFTDDDGLLADQIAGMRELVCEYAETYLGRAEAAAG